MNILNLLKLRFSAALEELSDNVAPLLDMIKPSTDVRFGDFQANCAMPLSKQLGKSARDVAADLIALLDIKDCCEEPEIAGPGFINLTMKTDWLQQQIASIAADDRLGVLPTSEARHVIVDFSSPNVAKPMHVGHLRSSVIGDSICRTLTFAGHKVTSDNHIGDWGTQFGMIIYGYRHFVDEAAYQADPVTELARLYRLVNQLSDYHTAVLTIPDLEEKLKQNEQDLADAESIDDSNDKKAKKKLKTARKAVETTRSALKSAIKKTENVAADASLSKLADEHPEIARKARLETSQLHAGDEANRKLWEKFLPECLQALQQVYDRLEIKFDLTLGESFYNPMLASVVDSLKSQGLATDSHGAVCVFLEGHDAPFIVQKSDGAFNYATTDLATIQYRVAELNADEMLYVVDTRQSEHFQALFATAKRWDFSDVNCRHVNFGTVMGDDGKPFKTRSGDNIGLESLIDEAVARARKIVDSNDDARKNGPQLSDQQRQKIAEIVGVGGIKYADLQHDRESDYVFSWKKMLATTGNTAAYMQYAYARICGIFRELNINRDDFCKIQHAVLLPTPQERALALQLLQFGQAVDSVLAEYRPHLMTAWLFTTANCLSSFYAACSVKNAESPDVQYSRLLLCDLAARGLKTGLSLLGIKTAELM